MNDKSANFPAIYYNVLKHERSLSVTGLLWVCILIDRLLCLYICQLSPRKFYTFFYPILSRYITVFCAFLCRFYSIYCAVILHYLPAVFVIHLYVFLWHAFNHSYNVVVSFAFFVFAHHTAHCLLLLVSSCMLYVVKKHCPEEAHLNRWAKRRLILKIARRSNLSA